jgi:leucyl/phenylalanyl-tRNA---protein transferase
MSGPERSVIIPPEQLVQAYCSGYFPMADALTGAIHWYTADPRAIIPLDPFHVPRRLRRSLRQKSFRLTRNRDFPAVIRGCTERDETWINGTLVASYIELHRWGLAHSVEVWEADELVGGLYGVSLGGAFFGESMFHRRPDASKVALVHLGEHLGDRGFRLLEIQMITPLTAQFGAREVGRVQYQALLAEALSLEPEW